MPQNYSEKLFSKVGLFAKYYFIFYFTNTFEVFCKIIYQNSFEKYVIFYYENTFENYLLITGNDVSGAIII